MRLTLYQRISVVLVLSFTAIVGALFFWSSTLELTARHNAEQRLHVALAEHIADDNPLLKQGVYDYQALTNLFHSLMILGPSFEFYFIAPDGEIMSYFSDATQIERQHINITPLLDFIARQRAFPIYGDDPKHATQQKIFSTAPIYNDNNLQGYLYIIIGGERYDSVISDVKSEQYLSKSLLLILSVVVFFFFILLILLRFFTHPLKLLSNNLREFKHSDFDLAKVNLLPWPAATHNEIHELGQVFNELNVQINEQFALLQNIDKTRREMLTDLSHDLRTPLAALQGYLETIQLKGNTLTEQQHQQFVGIAFNNATQLKKLVDQIFELAHLEGGEVSLQTEPFPLAELLYDIVAKFQYALQAKNIALDIVPFEGEFIVTTDIGKLERVFSNLIDNAIRHTSPQGNITIKITDSHPDYFDIAVIDNGTGIDSLDLPSIFEPRFRASNAICDDKEHGGLGLAITKKLLLLLGSDIHVYSDIGKGTRFEFTIMKN